MARTYSYIENMFRRKIIFVILLIAGIFSNGCVKKSEKVYLVGILSGVDFFADTADGFKAKMAELGYLEGKNIIYDLRKTNVDPAGERRILKEFIAKNVDLVFTFPTEVSVEAKAMLANTNIPLVFANANIEGVDLVKSVREPGGNLTGVRYPGPDLAIKRFEIMHEILPQAKNIWVAYQRDYPIVTSQLAVVYKSAELLGITLTEIPAANAQELQDELEKKARETSGRIDALFMIAEPLAVTPEDFLVLAKFAEKHRVPIGGASMSIDGYESIFGASTINTKVGMQAAVLADKIFKGIAAGSIPVVSADNFIQINYRAAKKLGLNIPEGLLSQSDKIIR